MLRATAYHPHRTTTTALRVHINPTRSGRCTATGSLVASAARADAAPTSAATTTVAAPAPLVSVAAAALIVVANAAVMVAAAAFVAATAMHGTASSKRNADEVRSHQPSANHTQTQHIVRHTVRTMLRTHRAAITKSKHNESQAPY